MCPMCSHVLTSFHLSPTHSWRFEIHDITFMVSSGCLSPTFYSLIRIQRFLSPFAYGFPPSCANSDPTNYSHPHMHLFRGRCWKETEKGTIRQGHQQCWRGGSLPILPSALCQGSSNRERAPKEVLYWDFQETFHLEAPFHPQLWQPSVGRC